MKQKRIGTNAPRAELRRTRVVIRPVFFVRVVVGEAFEDRTFEPPDSWFDIYQTLAGAFMTALRALDVASAVREYLILFVEADQSPAETRIGSARSVEGRLRRLAAGALSGKEVVSHAPLLGDDGDRGHLYGTVLRVDKVAHADALCEAAVEGEVALPEGGESKKAEGTLTALRTTLRGLIAEVPKDYDVSRRSLAEIGDAVREEFARALEPVLNAEAKRRPQATYEDKKELAKWVNAELRRFGLALKGPQTLQPCSLVAHPGNHPNIGRFQLDYTDETGRRHRTVNSVTLPHLELTLDNLMRAPYGQSAGHTR